MLNDVEIASKSRLHRLQTWPPIGLVRRVAMGMTKPRCVCRCGQTQTRKRSPRLVRNGHFTPPAGEARRRLPLDWVKVCLPWANPFVALREPSLGPCMGVKGGATGGSHAQVAPYPVTSTTGDFQPSPRHTTCWLRHCHHLHHECAGVESQTGGLASRHRYNDVLCVRLLWAWGPKWCAAETGFDITAASKSWQSCVCRTRWMMRERLGRIVLATVQHRPVRADALGLGQWWRCWMLLPNLVQTLEGLQCSAWWSIRQHRPWLWSVLATRMSMHLADWTVTEAGFGAFGCGKVSEYQVCGSGSRSCSGHRCDCSLKGMVEKRKTNGRARYGRPGSGVVQPGKAH